MQRCLDLAHEAASVGNYALGVLVFRNDEVLAESGSRRYRR